MGKLIKSDGTETIVDPKNGEYFTLNEMQAFVGGFIQQIYLAKKTMPLSEGYDIMLLNEEGKFIDGLEENHKATILLHQAGGLPFDYIVGDVLLIKDTEWR